MSIYVDLWNMAFESNDPFLRVFLPIWLVIYTLSWIYLVVAYVLSCLSLHTIAKRRGVLCPWLAWIPIGNVWILGSISDRYQSAVNGNLRRRRILLVLLSIAAIVAYVIAMVSGTHMTDGNVPLVILNILSLLASVGAMITSGVFCYISLYDVYKSCAPQRTMTYLMLSIFINVTVPIFLFSCRKLDLGMAAKEEKTAQIGDCAEENDLL